ncbi:MAG: penicillin-binding protein 2 [Patescibacteria group bacterium]|nr:penicillin-binding protein 2 [Patescibacteria group bacterium]
MKWRYRFIFFVFIFFFFLILSRLFYWQVVRAEDLSTLGKSQYGKYIKLMPKRGEIKTSDDFSIAANKLTYLVYVNPKEVKDKQKTIDILSSVLGVDVASASASLSLDRFWVSIKSKVDDDTINKLEKIALPGVGFEQEYSRFYPEASMAANLLGIVGKNELGDDKGYSGLEGYYDRQLGGKPGISSEVYDAFGKPVLSRLNENSKPIDGRNLVSSIDRAIQFIVENKLKKAVEKYGAEGGMVGIMDPKTGNIISMATWPSFDPSSYQKYSDDLYKNQFISNIYEPGSTFKPLIMASALDSKVVKPDTKCPICGGPVTIYDYKVKTWNDQYYKDTTMIDVIKHSDNTGMVFAVQSLGLDRLLDYLKKFGIGELTSIDLQGEVAPSVKNKKDWYPIDLATAGFGQGISITPIELLVGFSAIANKGIKMEPHVVSRIETSSGEIIDVNPKKSGRVISEETAKVMTEILTYAVDNGEAKWAKPKGYRIAGKTGTAQIPIAGHYDPDKTIASFIGFAPADDPKFSMLVILDRPKTSIYGSETAAPLFFDIAKDILTYYNIPPSE